MAITFEHFKFIAATIVPDPNIMNHALLYIIETLGMHYNVAITYCAIQPPYAAINYFSHDHTFQFEYILQKISVFT